MSLEAEIFLHFVHYHHEDGFKTTFSAHLFNAAYEDLNVVKNMTIPRVISDAKKYFAQNPLSEQSGLYCATEKFIEILDNIKHKISQVHCCVSGEKLLNCSECILTIDYPLEECKKCH